MVHALDVRCHIASTSQPIISLSMRNVLIGNRSVLISLIMLFAVNASLPFRAEAQPNLLEGKTTATQEEEDQSPDPAEQISIVPVATDEGIETRIEKILTASGWFENLGVNVTQGIVRVSGVSDTEEHKLWADGVAERTEGVVAVINELSVSDEDLWNLDPARKEITALSNSLLRALPWLTLATLILVISYICSIFVRSLVAGILERRALSSLLVQVGSRTAQIVLMLIGLYLVLRISGLTRLAVTILGGTGIVGLVIGVAFNSITENFLASIFLSIQRPFRAGDLVQIGESLGYVHAMTTRTTILMTLSGNHLQIPNAQVFKSTICNFTTNPNRREVFDVGIGYTDSIPHAQKVILGVLEEHPSVLKQPEPWVLVNNLGSSTVNLKVYFWLNGSQHSWLKVRSSVIRLVKRALQSAGISLPDEAREIIFPDGVPVTITDKNDHDRVTNNKQHAKVINESPGEHASSEAEGGLENDADELADQARRSPPTEEGTTLLLESK